MRNFQLFTNKHNHDYFGFHIDVFCALPPSVLTCLWITVCRESVASSYVDEDDSDTTSCNEDDPISYDDYMTSRRSSEFTSGTYASGAGRQSVDFADAELYNSLARK